MIQEQPKLERIVAEIPQDIKRRAKAKAMLEGRSFKDVIVELLEKWLAEEENGESAKMTLAI